MDLPKRKQGGDDANFCNEIATDKVRRRVIAASAVDKLAFLILSGSFNPIHTQHVRAIEGARNHLEREGWWVVGAFLAPSSDEYVRRKLGASAWAFRRRKELCELSVRDSEWISVCSKGEFSSNWVRRQVRQELERDCREALQGNDLTGVEVLGSDTALRMFRGILKMGIKHETQVGRKIYCFLRRRPGPAQVQRDAKILDSAARTIGIDLTLLDPESMDPPLGDVSSRAIRELLKKKDWDTLHTHGWVHPAVLEACQREEKAFFEK